jgi:hypothetical protein
VAAAAAAAAAAVAPASQAAAAPAAAPAGGGEAFELEQEYHKEASDEPALTVGSAVHARFGGGPHWFGGAVTKAHSDDGTFDILYDDTDREEHVHSHLIRRALPAVPASAADTGAAGEVAPGQQHQQQQQLQQLQQYTCRQAAALCVRLEARRLLHDTIPVLERAMAQLQSQSAKPASDYSYQCQ